MKITIDIPDSQIELIEAGLTFNSEGEETIEEVIHTLLTKQANAWAEAGQVKLVEDKISILKASAIAEVPAIVKFSGKEELVPELK